MLVEEKNNSMLFYGKQEELEKTAAGELVKWYLFVFCNAQDLSVHGAHHHLDRAYLSHIVGQHDPAEGAGHQPEQRMERQDQELEKNAEI